MFKGIGRQYGGMRFFLLVLIDIIVILVSLFIAFLLRFEGNIPLHLGRFINIALIFILAKIIIFYYLGLYRISFRYVGLPEILNIARAHIFSLCVLGIIILIFRDTRFLYGFPRSIIFIDFFISFLTVSSLRLYKRTYYLMTRKMALGGERVLIVGAGDAGEQLLRNINETKNCRFMPVGFIDDNLAKKGLAIHGVKILGSRNEIPAIVKRFNTEVVIIAMPSASSGIIRETVDYVRKAGITKIKILPPLIELIDGRVGVKDIRDMDIVNLLGRPEIKIDTQLIASYLKDKVIMVTGAAGSIGAELCRQILRYAPKRLIALDQDETGIFNLDNKLKQHNITCMVGNIQDIRKIEQLFRQFSPQIIFHAAAYKHVPLMEVYPEEAVKTNILGTRIVAEAALKYSAEKFVFISTDKAVVPTSVMGVTKRIAEIFIRQLNQNSKTRFLAVRFGNVLDSRGNMLEIFRQQIMERKEVTITDPEMERYLMTTTEAVLLVLEATASKESAIFALDMGKLVKVLDFAREVIRLYGYEPDKDIPIVFTGKRPGEKLYEELVSPQEHVLNTEHAKIFMVREEENNLRPTFIKRMEELIDLAQKGASRQEIISLARQLIPQQ